MSDTLPRHLDYFAKVLAADASSPWLCGGARPTIADFYLATVVLNTFATKDWGTPVLIPAAVQANIDALYGLTAVKAFKEAEGKVWNERRGHEAEVAQLRREALETHATRRAAQSELDSSAVRLRCLRTELAAEEVLYPQEAEAHVRTRHEMQEVGRHAHATRILSVPLNLTSCVTSPHRRRTAAAPAHRVPCLHCSLRRCLATWYRLGDGVYAKVARGSATRS